MDILQLVVQSKVFSVTKDRGTLPRFLEKNKPVVLLARFWQFPS